MIHGSTMDMIIYSLLKNPSCGWQLCNKTFVRTDYQSQELLTDREGTLIYINVKK